MEIAKEYMKHPITGEMIKPCEMYQTETEESTVQQIEESAEGKEET